MRRRRRSVPRPLALALALLLLAAPLLAARYTPSRTILPGPLTIQSGQLLLPDGTVGAPAVSFSAASGTGFRRIADSVVGYVPSGGVDRIAFQENSISQDSGGEIRWTGSGNSPNATPDLILLRDAANILAQRNGTNAQTQRWSETFTDASNYSRVAVTTSSSGYDLLGEAAGTGTLRLLRLGSGSVRWHIAASGDGSLGAVTDNASDFGASGASRPRDVFVARNFHVAGFVHIQSALAYSAHVVTIASNGVSGTANGETLSGLRSVYLVECLDGDGCTVTVAETGVAAGAVVQIFNISTSGSANHNLTMSDAAPLHLAGALTLAASQSVTLIYVVNRSGDGNFYESSRSAN